MEEGGGMNVMFKIAGTVVTPMLTGSILPGITRKSCIELLKSWGVPVEERLLSVDELFEAAKTARWRKRGASAPQPSFRPSGSWHGTKKRSRSTRTGSARCHRDSTTS